MPRLGQCYRAGTQVETHCKHFLSHTHNQQDTCALSLHPIPLSNGHPIPLYSPPCTIKSVPPPPPASTFHKQMSDRTTLIASLPLSVNIMQRGVLHPPPAKYIQFIRISGNPACYRRPWRHCRDIPTTCVWVCEYVKTNKPLCSPGCDLSLSDARFLLSRGSCAATKAGSTMGVLCGMGAGGHAQQLKPRKMVPGMLRSSCYC